MKYVLIVVIFCICVFVGYITYSKYNKRKKFYASLIMLAEKLSVEINFSRERLKILIENFDAGTKKNLLGIDEGFVSYLDKKNELTINDIFQKTSTIMQEKIHKLKHKKQFLHHLAKERSLALRLLYR